ncbi:MAG: SdiA-regulated domain-containing protein, partial [Gammaproteobacteria bacterium]|nr:SdiA-regulated domain-containing protein [Gammaproteobacteria bacterium]
MNSDSFVGPHEEGQGKQLRVLPVAVMAKRSLVTRTLDRVVPEKSKFLGFTWILAVILVVTLFSQIQGEANQFYGIAESQERLISFQYPVEIVEVPVVEGQRIDNNARLLEVRRYDLDVNLLVLDERINEIRAEQAATRHIVTAEIARLEAERGTQIETFQTKIDSLETQLRHNQALVDSISGSVESAAKIESPLRVKIRGLKAEKMLTRQMFQARIKSQKQKLADISGPDDARIAELEKQKNELLRQSKALVVHAPFPGSVGNVMFKQGEQVDAFNPVIVIQGNHTRHIKGYIHEAVSNHVQIGQAVWIQSLSAVGDETLTRGEVESLGNRIVEYPQRLKRSPLVAAWGREVVINVAPENDILQGAKVSVFLDKPQTILSSTTELLYHYLPIKTALAWNKSNPEVSLHSPRDIEVQIDNLKPAQIEASGIVWNPDSQSFMLVSDEQSTLFELSTSGTIINQFSLDSVGKITDLESISRDGSYYYLAASLSHDKKQELKPKRRKLMRLSLVGDDIHDGGSIDLYQALLGLLESNRASEALRDFIRSGIDNKSLDLEGHAVIDN